MMPRWFDNKNFPIDNMWADDPYWLPLVLEGKEVEASFTFGEDNSSVLHREVRVVEDL
jgi:hypothetical protein